MTNIYDQHKATFANVSAYTVTDKHSGDLLARIAFKFPKDGSGRLYAYVHWIGLPMVRGFAAGGGYDKASAACSAAISKAKDPIDITRIIPDPERLADWDNFRAALAKDNGSTWNDQLRTAGFNVYAAV